MQPLCGFSQKIFLDYVIQTIFSIKIMNFNIADLPNL